MNYKLRFQFFRRRNIFSFLHPPTLPQSLSNNPLKLSVSAAKLIGCPFFNGIHCLGIYTQNKTLYCRFFFSHYLLTFCFYLLMIQRTCIDYRLCSLIRTKNYKQITDHRRLLVLVQFNNFFFRKFMQSHTYH